MYYATYIRLPDSPDVHLPAGHPHTGERKGRRVVARGRSRRRIQQDQAD